MTEEQGKARHMAAQFARPHNLVRSNGPSHTAPNAALLIDFDNVTMGIRSDLSKELKSLLNSDIIKGKVAVQRAYADWRRYPQYIVPLAEASVDLIFAPAYGSAKKNATDIRLAIDALELVFTRPEIGTFILLSGDSDFSSLVLKLKEYGKYVIGVGIRESASDLLVQNCDEYYSYSVLSGLTKESDEERQRQDPWELVERAVRHMAARRDVMRSDRLKQVMLELDSTFNEKELGYSKFSRFLSDAVGRERLQLKKRENGQWEVSPPEATGDAPAAESGQRAETRPAREEPRGRRGGRGRDHDRSANERTPQEPREEQAVAETAAAEPDRAAREQPSRGRQARERQPRQSERAAQADRPAAERTAGERTAAESVDVRRQPVPEAMVAEVAGEPRGDLRAAYDLLRRAVEHLVNKNGDAARDSDLKRRMLELHPGWDESALGFSKFSRFLRQAHDAEVIDLHRGDDGSYQVTATGGRGRRPAESARPAGRRASAVAAGSTSTATTTEAEVVAPTTRSATPAAQPAKQVVTEPVSTPKPAPEATPAKADTAAGAEKDAPKVSAPEATQDRVAAPAPRGIGARLGTRGRAAPVAPPPLLPGQAVAPVEEKAEPVQVEKKAAPRREAKPAAKADTQRAKPTPAPTVTESVSLSERMGLPTDAEGVRSYILGRYKGVGPKTVDVLLEAFGATDLFGGMDANPDRVREVLGKTRRAEMVLEAWKADREQRAGAEAVKPAVEAAAKDSKPAAKAEKPATRASRSTRGGERRAKSSSKTASKTAAAKSGARGGAKPAAKTGARGGRGKSKAGSTAPAGD
jgi:uncharacterized protein (TIGR00288 family)